MTDGKLVHIEGNASLIGSITNTLQVFIGAGQTALLIDSERVVTRFQQLLDGHGLNRAQLLQVVPAEWDWSVADLSDEHALLRALTSERMAWLATAFGVRLEWLGGQGDCIYNWPLGYKQPQMFAAALAEKGWLGDDLRMTILAADYRTRTNGPLGLFTIPFSFPLAELDDGDLTIYRHLTFDTGRMDWSHPPCRYDATALARWFHCHANKHGWIPIVPAQHNDVLMIAEGTAFPGPRIPWSIGGYDNFEDRVLRFGNPVTGDGESLAAIANPELEMVLEYFVHCGLAIIQSNKSVGTHREIL